MRIKKFLLKKEIPYQSKRFGFPKNSCQWRHAVRHQRRYWRRHWRKVEREWERTISLDTSGH